MNGIIAAALFRLLLLTCKETQSKHKISWGSIENMYECMKKWVQAKWPHWRRNGCWRNRSSSSGRARQTGTNVFIRSAAPAPKRFVRLMHEPADPLKPSPAFVVITKLAALKVKPPVRHLYTLFPLPPVSWFLWMKPKTSSRVVRSVWSAPDGGLTIYGLDAAAWLYQHTIRFHISFTRKSVDQLTRIENWNTPKRIATSFWLDVKILRQFRSSIVKVLRPHRQRKTNKKVAKKLK